MKNKLDIKIVFYLLITFSLLLLYNYSDRILGYARHSLTVMKPLIIGALIAYLLNLIIIRLERSVLKKMQDRYPKIMRAISILLSIVIVSGVLYLIIKLILPQVITMLTSLVSSIPNLINQIQSLIESSEVSFLLNYLGENLTADFNNLSQRVLNFATTSINQLLTSFVQVIGGATSGLFSLIIAFSFSIYLLISKERLMQQANMLGEAFLSTTLYRRASRLATIAHDNFSGFFVGQTIEAVILGLLCIIGMMIFRFPFALTIGTFIGFTALIPLFGAWIGGAVGVILIASQDLSQALFFILFIIILQQIETNVIYPRVVGTSIGIPGIWVLVAITIGGGVAGIAGMLLGVPIVATIYQVVGMITRKRLEDKERKKPTEELIIK